MMKYKYIQILYGFLALVLITPVFADDAAMPNNPGTTQPGHTYYLSPKGKDTGDGSKKLPWKTIRHATQRLQPGDTLLLLSGQYHERKDQYKNIQITRSGKPGQYITFKAAPGHTPVIIVDTWNGIELWNASYIEINGLTIRGLPDPKDWKKNPAKYKNDPRYFGGGISVVGPQGSHHIRIVNNTVHQVGGNGISAGGMDQLLIEGNRVFNCAHRSDAGNSGISIIHPRDLADPGSGYGIVIRNNISYSNYNALPFKHANMITDGNGIILDLFKDEKPNTYSRRTLVANNLCFNNGGRGIHAYKYFNADIINNTLWKNVQTPILQQAHGDLSIENSGNIRAHNNLVVSDKGLPVINRPRKGMKSEILHNLFSGPRSREVKTAFEATNLIGIDPQFKKANSNFKRADFSLNRRSPAINRGKDALVKGILLLDIDGETRLSGNSVDIGAYEFKGNPRRSY